MPSATRGTFEKMPLDPSKLLIIKSFGKSRNLFSKRFLAAGGTVEMTSCFDYDINIPHNKWR